MIKTNLNWRNLHWLWLAILVIVLDQATKYLAMQHLSLYEPKKITDFFNLILAFNTGAAFSFLGNAGGWQRWLFLGISFIVSIGIIVYLPRSNPNKILLNLGLALILGGAIGNLIDRFALGYVIDFLDFYIGDYHWPAFNIADSAITMGAIAIIIDALIPTKDAN